MYRKSIVVAAAITLGSLAVSAFTVPAAHAQAQKATEFSELGQELKPANLKMPAGAESIRQLTAPLDDNGNNVLLNVYKMNGVVFADVLTNKNEQPWTVRNHIRMKAPMALQPDKMSVTLRYLEPARKRGTLLVATDPAGSMTFAFPKGFGGSVFQQEFLANSSANLHRTYGFDGLDSRGFVMVKSTIESSGEVKPKDDVAFFAWNGKAFIPRRPN